MDTTVERAFNTDGAAQSDRHSGSEPPALENLESSAAAASKESSEYVLLFWEEA